MAGKVNSGLASKAEGASIKLQKDREALYAKIKKLEKEYSDKGVYDIKLLDKINKLKSEYSGIEIERTDYKPVFPNFNINKKDNPDSSGFNHVA